MGWKRYVRGLASHVPRLECGIVAAVANPSAVCVCVCVCMAAGGGVWGVWGRREGRGGGRGVTGERVEVTGGGEPRRGAGGGENPAEPATEPCAAAAGPPPPPGVKNGNLRSDSREGCQRKTP